jgi:hypothetical protein
MDSPNSNVLRRRFLQGTGAGRVISGNVENVAERSALTTLIAILGRRDIYSGKEAVWKDVISV